MSLSAIRSDLVELIEPLVAAGGEVAPYPPESANVFPSIWLGDARAQIKTSVGFRTWPYRIPVTVAVGPRKAIYANERAAATTILDPLVALLAPQVQVGGESYGIEITEFIEGVIGPIGGEELVGFTLTIVVKEKPEYIG